MAVRELSFDRFVIPAFAVKAKGADYYVNIDKSAMPANPSIEETIKGKFELLHEVEDPIAGGNQKEPIVSLLFQDYPTMEELLDKLIEENVVVAYTPYFRGTERSTMLMPTEKDLTENVTLFRKYFFSDEEILDVITYYYDRVLDIRGVEITDEVVAQLKRPSERHLAIWVAYHLVDKRRLYESASSFIGQSFTDGTDYERSEDAGNGMTTTVNIGSVFSIQEDPKNGYYYDDFNRIGSDNFWGDRYSFWYRLMLYLRDLLETQFGDYSLRKDNVMQGQIELRRELDFRSYYDSYPFTLSPLARGIVSKTP